MTPKALLAFSALFTLLGATTQTLANTYTANVTTGNWSTTTSWSPTAPTGGPAAGDSVVIPSGKTITVDSSSGTSLCTSSGQSISVSGTLTMSKGSVTFGDVIINNGGTWGNGGNISGLIISGNLTNNGTFTQTGGNPLTFSGTGKTLSGTASMAKVTISGTYTVASGSVFTFPGSSGAGLTVNGTLDNFGVVLVTYTSGAPLQGSGQFTNDSNAMLICGTGNTAPSVTLICSAPGNTFSSAQSSIPNTTYYNLTCASNAVTVSSPGSITVSNNLTIGDGTTATLFQINGTSMTVKGLTTVLNASTLKENTSSGSATFQDIVINSGGLLQAGGNGYPAITLNGNLTNNGTMTSGTGSPGSIAWNLNGAGKTFTGAGLHAQYLSVNGSYTLGASVGVTATAATTVNNGGTLNCGVNNITTDSGSPAFTVASGGTLGIGSTAGITSSGATGNIQVGGTRTYNTGANYTYTGTANQSAGNGLPATVNNLTVTNTGAAGNNTVTLAQNTAVNGNLTVSAGIFNLNAKTLTPASASQVISSGTISGSALAMGATGKLIPGTDGTYGTATFSNNFTMTSGSTLNMDVNTTAGGANDAVAVTGTLGLNSTVIHLKAPSVGSTIDQANDYTLATATSITGTPSLVWDVAPANSGNFSLLASPTALKLHYSIPAASLTFTTSPADTNAGNVMSAVVVEAWDGAGGTGNPLPGASVTLALNTGSFAAGSTTTATTDASGLATFTNLQINAAGSYTITATSGSVNVTSSSFNINVGAAAKLAFGAQPTATSAGNAISPSVTVIVQDAGGNTVTGDTSSVTIGGTAFDNTSTLTVSAVSGVATFSNVKPTTAGNNITLTATDGSLTNATSSTFTVTAGTAAKLGISTQPSGTANAGAAFAIQPVVAVQDAYGNTATSSTAAISASASVGNLQGGTSVAAVGGVTTFTNLYATNAATITLHFTSGSLTPVDSGNIVVSGGTVAALAWTTLPAAAVYGTAFSTKPVLQTEDQYGNPSTNGLPGSLPLTISSTAALIGTTSYDLGTGSSNGMVVCNDLGFKGGVGGTPALIASVMQGYGSPVSGMNIWLDASIGSSVLTNANGIVTNWQDLSGNGFNFVSNTLSGGGTPPSYTTTVQAGRKGVTFATSEMINGSYINGTNTISVFLVYKGSGSRCLSTFSSSANTHDYFSTSSFEMDPPGGAFAGKPHFFRNNTGVGNFTFDSSSAYHAEEFISTTSANTEYISSSASLGNSAGSGGSTGNYAISRIAIGGGLDTPSPGTAANGNTAGTYCELLVYNSDQSANRTAIETYLQRKWMTNSYGNYSLVFASTNASSSGIPVSAKPVTITSGVAANDKTYDATNTATLGFNNVVLSGIVSPDSVTVATNGYLAAFSGADAANGLGVTASGLTLTSASGVHTNYTLTQPVGFTANITAKALGIVGLSANGRTYDATMNATLSGSPGLQSAEAAGSGSASDGMPYSGDSVSVTGSATSGTFASKEAANGITVTANLSGLSLTGDQAGNYSIGSPSPALSANIMPKALTISGLSADNKSYDGTTNATLSGTASLPTAESPGSGSTADGMPYTGDTANLTGAPSGYFASAGPGNGIGVFVTGLSLAGSQAGDYSLMSPLLSADITASTVTVNLYSSENPSGYNDSVTLTASNTCTGTTPTGDVVFLNNGAPFSTNTVDGNGAASVTTSTLPRGTNTIEADFSGTGTFAGVMATNTLNQIVTNHPPVAAIMTVTRMAGMNVKIALSDLATNWTDTDGDTISLTGIDLVTTIGVNLFTNDSWILYPNGSNTDDQISYGISDGFGGTNIGYINIIINTGVVGNNSIVGITTGSTNVINAYGIPGYNYILERTTNMVSAVWVDVSTNTAAGNGAISAGDDFSDLGGQPPDSAFYRLKWQP